MQNEGKDDTGGAASSTDLVMRRLVTQPIERLHAKEASLPEPSPFQEPENAARCGSTAGER